MAMASSSLAHPPPGDGGVDPSGEILPGQPLPTTIKQELEDEDSEDGQNVIGLVIKPVIENILSSTSSESSSCGGGGEEEGSPEEGGISIEESEESVSEFEEDLFLPNNGSSCITDFYFNPSNSRPRGRVGSVNNSSNLMDVTSTIGRVGSGEQRKKREAFTLQQKLQVLEFLETHSVNATSRFYKVDPKSIRLWRSQKIKIQQTVQEELTVQSQQGELDGVTPRKRISGAGRKKRNKPVIVKIEENPNKRHRRTIKLSDKVEIIRLIEHGQTQSDVARSLGISQSTVQTIWSNKGDILERNASPRKKRKNLHWKKYSTIDGALFSWVRQCRESGVTLDTKILHDKAVEYAEYYKQVEFKGQANRWVDVFKRRHSLSELDRQDRLQLAAGVAASTTSISSSSQSALGLGIGLEQHTLGQLTSSLNNHTHFQQQHQSSSIPLHQNQQHPPHPQQNNHLDFVPDFDLSSLPGLMAGLYPPGDSLSLSTTPSQTAPNNNGSFPLPSFNSHLPVISVPGGVTTTCDAMKYVELIRSWINSASFGGETEELLNNHLNAIENAVLKRRMTEMMAPTGGQQETRR